MFVLQKIPAMPFRAALRRVRRRPRPWLRRLAAILVAALSLTGAVSTYRTVAGPPDVGHFRSAEGRREYLEYYRQAMETMPAPSQTQDVATSFGTVRVYTWAGGGEQGAPPVVLLPGRTSGAPMWSANVPLLARSRRVIALDALGDAGMSVQSAPLTSVEDQAAWVDEVISAVAPEGAHLVGHSFGGATAAVYARLHPDRVRSLTLLEPVFTFAYPPAGIMAWTMAASVPALPESWRNRALERIGGERLSGADPMELMITAGAESFDASLPTPSPLTDEEAEALTMPVYLAIAGSGSVAGGSRAAERAQEVLPRASIQVWDGATHSLPMQEAEPLTPVLEQFWAQADAGAS